MKTIIITGCSWGCGEWNFVKDEQVKQRYSITHPGLVEYFTQDGWNVINLSQHGESNHKLIHSLYYFLAVNHHLNIKHIFFIKTDIVRSFKDKSLDIATLSNNTPTELINAACRSFYSDLNHSVNIVNREYNTNFSINLIGGLSDLIEDYSANYENLNFLIPSWSKLYNNSLQTTLLVDTLSIDFLHQRYFDKSQTLTFIEKSLERHQFFDNNKQLFWPDGYHPNRYAHKLMYDAIKIKLNL